jgi:hypothetical protein
MERGHAAKKHGPGFGGEGVDEAKTDVARRLTQRRASWLAHTARPGLHATSLMPLLDTTLAAHPPEPRCRAPESPPHARAGSLPRR